jgi:hypothetical protein
MWNVIRRESIGRETPRIPRFITWSRITSTNSSASGMSATNASTVSGAPSSGRSSNSSWTAAISGVALPGCGARPAAKTFYYPIVAGEGVFVRHAIRSAPCCLPNTSTRKSWAIAPSANTS